MTAPPMEFQPWPKIARLRRECLITEKIDGTNGCIVVDEVTGVVAAQSRNRLLVNGATDSFGFAQWVATHALALRAILGPGCHFGEWYGAGIQRRYGLAHEKRFALFNVFRWGHLAAERSPELPPGLGTVPLLYRGPFTTQAVDACLDDLRQQGSYAAPGFMAPEGIVVFHVAAQTSFKVTLVNDDAPKGPR